ncbi:hypothetical protein SAMD00023353_5600310 [Rosellinia necatrix]|uniref:Uncharacterized protein n=1 Tax=Rosellinia necatrix TaxID=77044 RepID=A0A1W2TRN9_ROSNE|nr:hypothetical protein SAMD00023353_5600310 [Rosellinia necatrix]
MMGSTATGDATTSHTGPSFRFNDFPPEVRSIILAVSDLRRIEKHWYWATLVEDAMSDSSNLFNLLGVWGKAWLSTYIGICSGLKARSSLLRGNRFMVQFGGMRALIWIQGWCKCYKSIGAFA